MPRIDEGVKYSEALYGVDARLLGTDFDVSVPDEDGKVSVWVSTHSTCLIKRAAFLDVRNGLAGFLSSLHFRKHAELDAYVENPYRRRLLCTKDDVPEIFVTLNSEGIEIGFATRDMRREMEPFLSLRRSFDTLRSERPEEMITGKAMRAVEAIMAGGHIPTALNSFLYEYADGEGPLDGWDRAPNFPHEATTPSHRERDAHSSWIPVPNSQCLERFKCYRSGGRRFKSDTRVPKLSGENGSVLVAYNLTPTEADPLAANLRAEMERVRDVVRRTRTFVHSVDSIITRGFRTVQEYSRDRVVSQISELGFNCFLPNRHFSAAGWYQVMCRLDNKFRQQSEDSISHLSVSFGQDDITIVYDCDEEMVLSHDAAGGFDTAYHLVNEICYEFSKGTLSKEVLLARVPAKWRRIKRGDNGGLWDTFGVGDYIGDGIWMTPSGPADVGR